MHSIMSVENVTGVNLNTLEPLSTYQITTYLKQLASLAVDGDITTSSCTNMGRPQPWWAVELAESSYVLGVNVTNYNSTNWG
jgi:hypothetical protein